MLQFDQLTWFAVAERLEREKDVLMHERGLFKRQISDQAVSGEGRRARGGRMEG